MAVDFEYVPEGWKKIKISKKLFFQEGPGVRKWQFTNEGIKLLNVGNINRGKVDLSATDKHLSVEEATGKYAHFLVDEGDLLIACSGIVVDNFYNKIAFAEKEHLPLCLNTSTMRFKPLEEDVDLNYFKYFLQTVHFSSQLQKLITGSAQLNFGPSHIKKIDFLYPPLKTQQRIAGILDDAAALRDKTAQLLTEYDLLAQSIFLEMFGDRSLFEIDILGNNIKLLNSKRVPVKSADRKKMAGEFPYYGASGVIDHVDDFLFEEETLLIGEDGANLISRSTPIAFRAEGKYWVNNHAHVISKQSPLHIVFLEYYINSINLEKYITGSAQPKLNSSNLKKIEVPVPPIELQNEFADKIALIEQQKALAKQELQESEDLFNCLLQQAFKGEL